MPSLLAGDFGNLESSALRAQDAGADALHMDIMDGHFVPNISFGPDVVGMARRVVKIQLSVHLMLVQPDLYLQQFAQAGANTLLIHVESGCDIARTLQRIRELGMRPGLALNPETPGESVIPYLPDIDEVLCMTVHPGFGGQKFMQETLPKISALSEAWFALLKKNRKEILSYRLAVDGGIDLENISAVAGAGVNVFIAGSALFNSTDMARDVSLMRTKAKEALKHRIAQHR